MVLASTGPGNILAVEHGTVKALHLATADLHARDEIFEGLIDHPVGPGPLSLSGYRFCIGDEFMLRGHVYAVEIGIAHRGSRQGHVNLVRTSVAHKLDDL